MNYEGKPAYDILLETDYSKLSEEVSRLNMTGRKFMIITDSTVGKYYKEIVKEALKSVAQNVFCYEFPAGEISKNLETVNLCYEQLILAGFDRNDILVALGGGVVGDLTGFVAATYLRGIRFIQLPTSLLSMVDSSIGGKTGVDYKAYKNMVGAFHQPKLVYMNLSTLNTLSAAEYFSGMGEIIKHGLIKDAAYYQWLKDNAVGIGNKEPELIREMIYRSCCIKKDVVERDPKELGDRALLNFGHTLGHAIEKLKNFQLLHGECICIGMAAAAFISLNRGFISMEEYKDILTTIQLFHEPIKASGIVPKEVYQVSRSDKKMDGAKVKFILLQAVGNAIIDTTVSKEEILEALSTVIE